MKLDEVGERLFAILMTGVLFLLLGSSLVGVYSMIDFLVRLAVGW